MTPLVVTGGCASPKTWRLLGLSKAEFDIFGVGVWGNTIEAIVHSV